MEFLDKILRKREAIKKLKGSQRKASKDKKKKEKYLSQDKISQFKFGGK